MAVLWLAVVALAAPVPVEGKRFKVSTHDVGRYEGQYGIPIYWSLSLIVGPTGQESPPLNTSIRTRGILSAFPKRGGADVKRHGHEAQVVGAFTTGEGFLFWDFDSGPSPERPADAAPQRTLEQLITRPDRFVGRIVTVRGHFRGANLFGDYAPPTRARRRTG